MLHWVFNSNANWLNSAGSSMCMVRHVHSRLSERIIKKNYRQFYIIPSAKYACQE